MVSFLSDCGIGPQTVSFDIKQVQDISIFGEDMTPTQEVNFLTTLLPVAGIIFIIAVGVILMHQHFRKNLYQQMLAQEELKNIYQQGLLKSSIEGQERERKRIAQDMHDELGAALAIARMQLVQLEQQQVSDTNLAASLKQVRMTTEAILASMRKLSHELMPAQLEQFGLIRTISGISDQLNGTNNIAISFVSPDELDTLSRSAELALYRICMEMIHNTIKHSGATEIEITLEHDDERVAFCYRDNGKGLTGEKMQNGLGMRSMEARANSIGATLQIGSGSEGGFNASVIIPAQTTAR